MTNIDETEEDVPNRGLWTAEIRNGKLQLNHMYRTKKGRSNFGNTHKNYEQKFHGLSQIDESSSVEGITFHLESGRGDDLLFGRF